MANVYPHLGREGGLAQAAQQRKGGEIVAQSTGPGPFLLEEMSFNLGAKTVAPFEKPKQSKRQLLQLELEEAGVGLPMLTLAVLPF